MSALAQEVAHLRAQLEEERLARIRAEARAEGERAAYERVLVLLCGGRMAVREELAERPASPAPPPPQEAAPPARHAAASVTVTRDSVTASVTEEERERKKRAQSRERSRNFRLRRRSVTAQRDGVTASVTQEEEKNRSTTPSPPSVTLPHRGTLALVTAAARDAPRGRPRPQAATEELTAAVQAMRSAWNELAAPHGFPPWGRTSGRLLTDALAALERRPLEEWRRVFALVPRSPVCRGELRTQQRTSLLWLLTGRTRDGYEPAEKLLSGAWTLDPERTAEEPPAASEAGQGPPEETPAGGAWAALLEALRTDRREYACVWLEKLRPVGVVSGELLLEAPDLFYRDWVDTHLGELLRKHAVALGHAGVRLVLPGERCTDDRGGRPP